MSPGCGLISFYQECSPSSRKHCDEESDLRVQLDAEFLGESSSKLLGVVGSKPESSLCADDTLLSRLLLLLTKKWTALPYISAVWRCYKLIELPGLMLTFIHFFLPELFLGKIGALSFAEPLLDKISETLFLSRTA